MLATHRRRISAPSVPEIFCGAMRVAERLGHLAAVAVDHEAVREQALVRRMAVEHAGSEQRRVEPAAVLVRAFEVHVGGIGRLGLVRAAQHGEVRGARVEPDVERVAALFVLGVRRRAARSAVTLCHASMPPFSTRFATSSSSSGVRGCSAPVSLCRKNGIGTPHWRWRESVQSGRLAIMPCRRALPQSGKNCVFSMPRSAVSRRLSPADFLVHRGEPLRRGAQDHRRLVPPAVHVAVHVASSRPRAARPSPRWS